MSFNFPLSPTVGDKYPTSVVAGQPQYIWDGVSWNGGTTTSYMYRAGDTMTGPLVLSGDPTADLQPATRRYVVAKTGDSMSGDLIPSVAGTLNLGSAVFRWATVFTSDLSLNNGIGDWTIVEGEDDLFLYNNKRNKVYKFMLYEVAPAMAPSKKG